MQTQELLTTILLSQQARDMLLSAVAAMILCKQASYESVWDMSNRICDRYLPKQNTV